MRLRAHIVIDMDATDFQEAAAHQQRVLSFYESVRGEYGQAKLEFRQRRNSTPRIQPLGKSRHHTGRMSDYEE